MEGPDGFDPLFLERVLTARHRVEPLNGDSHACQVNVEKVHLYLLISEGQEMEAKVEILQANIVMSKHGIFELSKSEVFGSS
jgi:hypothetical protein